MENRRNARGKTIYSFTIKSKKNNNNSNALDLRYAVLFDANTSRAEKKIVQNHTEYRLESKTVTS